MSGTGGGGDFVQVRNEGRYLQYSGTALCDASFYSAVSAIGDARKASGSNRIAAPVLFLSFLFFCFYLFFFLTVCNAGVEHVLTKTRGEVMTGKLHRSDRHAAPDDSGFAGGKNKGLKKVKQSNHNIYTIPYGMEPWADEPLYLVVARWGLQLKRWINRNDIAAVFHIPDRQASFQLSYISRKKDRVACRTRYVPAEDTGRQRVEIFIDSILPAPVECQTHAPHRRRNAPAKQTGMISRGVGSGMVDNTGLWERLLKGCREGRDDE